MWGAKRDRPSGTSPICSLARGLIVMLESVRKHNPADVAVLATVAVAVAVALAGRHMPSAFRAAPPNFPTFARDEGGHAGFQ